MVKLAVRWPFENMTLGSSDPASGANDSVELPVSATGAGPERLIPIVGWLPGFNVSVTPVMVNEGNAGLRTSTENEAVVLWAGLLASVTRMENEKAPEADGTPDRLPLLSSEIPGGSDPLATENVRGAVPPVAETAAE
jgi:hypothetical protein